MTIASDLLQRHIQTLVADNAQWQTLIADDLCGNSPTRPPSAIRRGSRGGRRWWVTSPGSWGRWSISASSTSQVYACADPDAAVAEVKAEGLDQADGAALSPGVCGVPACGRRQDRVPPRIFRSRACGQGAGHANS